MQSLDELDLALQLLWQIQWSVWSTKVGGMTDV